jgi:hypothetical protein
MAMVARPLATPGASSHDPSERGIERAGLASGRRGGGGWSRGARGGAWSCWSIAPQPPRPPGRDAIDSAEATCQAAQSLCVSTDGVPAIVCRAAISARVCVKRGVRKEAGGFTVRVLLCWYCSLSGRMDVVEAMTSMKSEGVRVWMGQAETRESERGLRAATAARREPTPTPSPRASRLETRSCSLPRARPAHRSLVSIRSSPIPLPNDNKHARAALCRTKAPLARVPTTHAIQSPPHQLLMHRPLRRGARARSA